MTAARCRTPATASPVSGGPRTGQAPRRPRGPARGEPDDAAGQTLVIIGRSGGGKSVLLKHLIGLLKPDAGEILVEGRNIVGLRERQLGPDPPQSGHPLPARRAFRFHERRGKRGVSLRESGERDPRKIADAVREALDVVDLDGQQKKMPVNLSGGMKKRVALARAIICRPRCILYDEPTAGLDPVVSDSINLLIRRLQQCSRSPRWWSRMI